MLDPLSFPQPLILDMGAGNVVNKGVTRVDAYYPDTDIKADMWNIPLPDGCVDMVYSNNALEHVSKFDVVPTIREWHRLLKHGGSLVTIVPDLEWACKFWLECQANEWSLDIIYGLQTHGGEFHKTGFTKKLLWDYLVIANPGGWFVEKLEYMENSGRYTKTIDPQPLANGLQKVLFSDVQQRLIVLQARKSTLEDMEALKEQGLVEEVDGEIVVNLIGV